MRQERLVREKNEATIAECVILFINAFLVVFCLTTIGV